MASWVHYFMKIILFLSLICPIDALSRVSFLSHMVERLIFQKRQDIRKGGVSASNFSGDI